MKVVAIVQARMGSTRFPGKILKEICGRPMLELLLMRLSESTQIDQVVVATGDSPANSDLIYFLNNLKQPYYIGSEGDVLGRFFGAAKKFSADVIVRITGDCPLVDPVLVDEVISCFKHEEVDYFSNVSPPTYPDGLDVEVFSFSALSKAYDEAVTTADREHVTTYIRQSGLFKTQSLKNYHNLSAIRWTVDEPEDLELVSKIFSYFHPKINFGWREALTYYRHHPELENINSMFHRNEGANMGSGQKLWKRAKSIIPGGNMLLSKRAEMFLPDHWPAYFSKAKGCCVWDLDGVEFTDMSLMGVGANTLGYGDSAVDMAVQRAIADGNMSTLNCPEEVFLAEQLVELHPWADMVRFARTGGEANSIAIRIGRASSGRDKVAICGYHGWHDWYLSANLGDHKGLDGHLLPGLEPNGVPRDLKGSVIPFQYNDLESLEKIVANENIGVIMMEVFRNQEPRDNFLQKVRDLATKNNIVLIFDECTSGFRQTYGGLHIQYGVNPDIAVFGKALGNGYAVTAIVGKKGVMEAAQTTFISSTFWTERIGSVAGLKTLERMKEMRSWELITDIGKKIQKQWKKLAVENSLGIEIAGLPALASFSFNSKDNLKYKTLITQEMLKEGFLASNAIYSCVQHSPEIMNRYFEKLNDIFKTIRECEDGRSVDSLLLGPVCHSGFKRLN